MVLYAYMHTYFSAIERVEYENGSLTRINEQVIAVVGELQTGELIRALRINDCECSLV